MKPIFYTFFFLLLQWLPGSAQITTDESIRISILTCAPGDQIYSIYGHNAIRIIDSNKGTDMVYNYGTFDFDTPGFAIKFMRGKLPYVLSIADYYDFLDEYKYYKRAVTEQVLYLDTSQKQKIIQYLDLNMQPENRAYKYDFFMDNCATRLRDIINKNVSNFDWDETKASGKTFRQMIKEYQQAMPWTNFGIDLIIGAPADRKTTLSEEAFLPDYLSTAIQYAQYKDPRQTGLQFRKTDILTFPPKPTVNNFLLSPWMVFIILILIEINIYFRFLKGNVGKWINRYDVFWLVILTSSSVLMLFMWFGTDHIPTKYNWNILWANPLIPVWWWMHKKGNPYSDKIAYFIAACILVSMINAIPGCQFLPQFFHPLVIMIGSILLIKGVRLKNNITGKKA
jgi:Domain of unknown function (DUF4105)